MISTATALAFLGAPVADTDLVAGIVTRASETLQRDLGFYIGVVAARTAIRDGGPGYGHTPVTEIVLVDDVLDATEEAPIVLESLNEDWEWETIATTDWRRDGRTFYHRSQFPPGRKNIRFTYRSGWAVDTGPGELRDLVLRLVQNRYTDSQTEGVQSETLSDFAYTFKDGTKLAEDYSSLVAKYRRTLPV